MDKKGVRNIILVALLITLAPAVFGDVVITEIMYDPSSVSDANGEYVELYNTDPLDTVELYNWTLRDEGSNSHIILKEDFIILPESFVVLCINDTITANGGVVCDYKYSSFSLTNIADGVILKDEFGIEQDRVNYNESNFFPTSTGASIELKDPSLDNNDGLNWVKAIHPFGNGDKGTPGLENNLAPNADNDAYSVTEDTPTTISSSLGVLNGDSDPDRDSLTVTLNLDVSDGTLALATDGSFTYTPNANFLGTDNFTYTVSDGAYSSNTATVTLTITPVNDAPVVSNIPAQVISEGASFTTINLDSFGSDVEDIDSSLVWDYSGETQLMIVISSGRIVTISTPNTNWNGAETITFTATDSEGLADSDAATFTVTAVNDAPSVTSTPITSATEDTPYLYDVDVSDPDDSSFLFILLSSISDMIIDSMTGLITWTPNNDDVGMNSVLVSVSDGEASDTQAFDINVANVNDAPVVSDIPDQTALEGASFTTINLDAYVSDVDNADSSIIWTYTGNTESVVDIINRVATITPIGGANWNGAETITFTATDVGGLSDSDSVTFTVTPVNDAPVISDIPGQTALEGASFTTINLDAYVSDVDNADSSIIWTYTGNTESVVDITNRVATILAPNVDWFGSETITFTATDPEGLSQSNDAAFELTPVNDQPVISAVLINDLDVAADKIANITEDVEFTVEVTSTDVDTTANSLRIDLTVSTVNGTPLSMWGAEIDPDNQLKFNLLLSERNALLDLNLVVSDGTALSLPNAIKLYIQPALDFTKVMVNGVENSADPIHVDVGQEITISFGMVNNFDETLEHVGFTAKVTGGSNFDGTIYNKTCQGVQCDTGSWAMLPEYERGESFAFTIPINLNRDDFTLTLNLSEKTGYGMIEDILFAINRTEHAAEIIGLNTNTSNLSCLNTAILNLTLTNTGQSKITPEVIIYDRAKDLTAFNSTTGEFSSSAGKVHEEELSLIPSLDTSEEKLEINISSLTTGTKTFYVYIVNPFFNEFFVGDSGQVSINIADCVANFFPTGSSVTLRELQSQRFNLTLSEPTTNIHWYLNGSELPFLTGSQEYLFTAATVGQHTILATAPEQNKTWVVTVSNVPALGQFTANIPSSVTLNQLASFNLELENSFGKIAFDSVNLQSITNFSMITIGSDFVFINTTTAPSLKDKQATITLKRTFNNPTILYDTGYNPNSLQTCSAAGVSCTSLGNANGQYSFIVRGFSTYKIIETTDPNLAVSEILIDETPRGKTALERITFTNPGTLQNLTDMQYRFFGVDAKYTASLTGFPSSLGPGQSAEVQLNISIPDTENMYLHAVGTLEITANNGTETITRNMTILLKPKQFLLINSVEINGKSSGDFNVKEINTIEVEVKNDYSKDLEDVVVTVRILDVDRDDLEEESDEFDLDAGDKETVTVEFDLRKETIDEESYTIEIIVEGTGEDDTEHEARATEEVKIELENHELMIEKISSPGKLSCDRNLAVQVSVKNLGKSDEEDVEVRLYQETLGVDEKKIIKDLAEFIDDDNTEKVKFNVELGQQKTGDYPMTIEVYRDEDLEDSEEFTLTVESCSSSTSSLNTNLAGKNLVDQLEKSLARSSTTDKNTKVTTSFRDSTTYTGLLAVLVVLLMFAVILGVIVLFKRE